MGNTLGSASNDVVALVQPGEQEGVEAHRPDAIVGFHKADVVPDQGIGE
jgi:hypothetical protein